MFIVYPVVFSTFGFFPGTLNLPRPLCVSVVFERTLINFITHFLSVISCQWKFLLIVFTLFIGLGYGENEVYRKMGRI
jgi:hypothetical protein